MSQKRTATSTAPVSLPTSSKTPTVLASQSRPPTLFFSAPPMEPWIATRPQDWHPAARAMLFREPS